MFILILMTVHPLYTSQLYIIQKYIHCQKLYNTYMYIYICPCTHVMYIYLMSDSILPDHCMFLNRSIWGAPMVVAPATTSLTVLGGWTRRAASMRPPGFRSRVAFSVFRLNMGEFKSCLHDSIYYPTIVSKQKYLRSSTPGGRSGSVYYLPHGVGWVDSNGSFHPCTGLQFPGCVLGVQN